MAGIGLVLGALALMGAFHPTGAYAQRGVLAATRYVAPSCAGVPTPCYTVIQSAVDAAVGGR